MVHAQKPMYYTIPPEPAAAEEEGETQAPADNLARLLEQRAPQLAEAVASAGLRRGIERFQHFLEKSVAGADLHSRLDGDPKLAASVLDIFEHSFYFADESAALPGTAG